MEQISLQQLGEQRHVPARRRLNVLICAHEFSPAHGSECAVGWNVASRLAKYHDVRVLAASGSQLHPYCYRDAYHSYVREVGPVPGMTVCFVDQPLISRLCARINVGLTKMADGAGFRPLFYAALRAWQRAAYEAGDRLGFAQFDVIHQLTPIGFRNPGYLWRSGRPFVLGPISGMYSVPLPFARALGTRSCVFEMVRTLSNVIQARGRIRRAIRAAGVVWAVTAADEDLVRRVNSKASARMVEAGSPDVEPMNRLYRYGDELRLCWSGRHDAAKALPLVLQAIADSEINEKIHLTVLGAGPMTASWRALSERLGLRMVDWKGWMPHAAALAEVGKANIFVHTSVREATSVVVLEALSLGLPVICHDACGMSAVVDETCGIKVPLIHPDESIRGFRDAIKKLLDRPELVGELSAGALVRSRELTWDAKAKEIAEAYTTLVRAARSQEEHSASLA